MSGNKAARAVTCNTTLYSQVGQAAWQKSMTEYVQPHSNPQGYSSVEHPAHPQPTDTWPATNLNLFNSKTSSLYRLYSCMHERWRWGKTSELRFSTAQHSNRKTPEDAGVLRLAWEHQTGRHLHPIAFPSLGGKFAFWPTIADITTFRNRYPAKSSLRACLHPPYISGRRKGLRPSHSVYFLPHKPGNKLLNQVRMMFSGNCV